MPAVVKILTKIWLLFFLGTIAAIGFVTVYLVYFPLYVLAFVRPRWRENALRAGIRVLLGVQPWFDGDVRIEVPPVDGRGVLLVSNHRSHLDVFILLSRVSGIRIMAKSTLFKIPFLSMMMRASRQIGVERGRLDAWVRAMDQVKLRLRAGERVHFFPEMTRCSPGFAGLRSFAAGPFLAALQEDAMVVPMVFRGTDQAWPKGQFGLNYRRPVHVRTLAPLRARDFATAEQLKGEVHKQILAALEAPITVATR